MKLLQINSVANIGSTGRIAEAIGNMAIRHGWESYIAYGRDAARSNSTLIRIGRKIDTLVHAILSRLFDVHGLCSKRATKHLLKEIDRIEPDIIHIHNLHGYYINVPLLIDYAKRKNIPTVITMHDFWFMTGHCAYINKSCQQWMHHCHHCPRLKEYPSAFCDRSFANWEMKARIFSNAKNITFVPVSYYLYELANKSLLKDNTFRVIHNGIDVESFKPVNPSAYALNEIDWTKFNILTVATRWTSANGFGDVMALSSLLPEDCRIIMVGVDDKQLTTLPTNIIGIKRTENIAQLRELYSRADVTFNPNTEVTFGLVTIESLACGTPVVVLKGTAGEELIENGIGFCIDKVEDMKDTISLVKALDKYNTPQRCRNHVLRNFDNESKLCEYFELYDTILRL